MGVVKFEGTSDFSKVQADYQKLQREVVKVKEENKKLTKASEDGSRKTQQGHQKTQTGLKATTLLLGVHATAVAALQRLWAANAAAAEDYIQKAKQASAKQAETGSAQADFVTNLGDVGGAEVSKRIEQFKGLQKQVGFPSQAEFFRAASELRSAVGDTDLTAAILSQTAPLFKTRPEQLAPTASAIGDLATIAGATSEDEIKQLIGLVLSTQGEARITSLSSFKNVAPAIAAGAVVDTGSDRIGAIKESAAAFAAVGAAIKDPEGSLTKGAIARLTTKLAELLPEKDVVVGGEVVRVGTGLKTLDERLKAVQGSTGLQEEFFRGGDDFSPASFEGPVMPVIEDLLTNTAGEAARRYEAALRNITTDQASVDRLISKLDTASPELRAASQAARGSAAGDASLLGMGEAGIKARIEQAHMRAYEASLASTGERIMSTVDAVTRIDRLDMDSTPEELASEAIEKTHSLERDLRKSGFLNLGGPRDLDELSTEEQERLAIIREERDILKEMLAELKATRGERRQRAEREIGAGRER